jgi:hypothetical protein
MPKTKSVYAKQNGKISKKQSECKYSKGITSKKNKRSDIVT